MHICYTDVNTHTCTRAHTHTCTHHSPAIPSVSSAHESWRVTGYSPGGRSEQSAQGRRWGRGWSLEGDWGSVPSPAGHAGGRGTAAPSATGQTGEFRHQRKEAPHLHGDRRATLVSDLQAPTYHVAREHVQAQANGESRNLCNHATTSFGAKVGNTRQSIRNVHSNIRTVS